MPKRLLSIRGRKTDSKSANLVIEPPEYFDFDFRSTPNVFPRADPQNEGRPRTAGRIESGPKRQRTFSQSRPRSTSGPLMAVDKRMQLTKVEDGWIGVAFGSPTHPPVGWMEYANSTSIDGALQDHRTLPTPVPSKWKKLGDRFRQKPTSSPLSNHQSTRDDHNCEKTIKMPLQHPLYQNPPSPARPSTTGQDPSSLIMTPEFKITEPSAQISERAQSATQAFPKLEIEIPSIQMDRYSVMFRNVTGISSSNLLVRRSKAITDLKALQIEQKYDLPPVPVSTPRRMTTPITAKAPYSLFPPQQNVKLNRVSCSPKSPLKEARLHLRSASSPAEISPRRDAFDPVKLQNINDNCPEEIQTSSAEPNESPVGNDLPEVQEGDPPNVKISTDPSPSNELETTNEDFHKVNKDLECVSCGKIQETQSATAVQDVSTKSIERVSSIMPPPLRLRTSPSNDSASSPEDITASSDKEDTPWLSRESFESLASSRSSIGDAIFFDIKALRDSKHQENSQFFISRPDSTAVELARSRSRKARANRSDQTQHNLPVESEFKSFCMSPDLQAAEYVCVNSRNSSTDHLVRLSMFDETIAEVERLATVSNSQTQSVNPVQEPPKPKVEQKSSKLHLNLPTRLQGLAIGIPSPITERSEEETPNSAMRRSFNPRIHHIATQASPRTKFSPQSFTCSTFDVPPPVPEKDLKFLPISKYATKRVASELPADKSPRPHTVTRSLTEPHIYTAPHPTPYMSQDSTTFSARVAAEIRSSMSPRSKSTENAFVAVSVQPTTEVSIARTVSLRRKTSHQILVSRSTSKRDDRPQLIEDGETLHLSLENRARSPILHQVPIGHKAGKSMNLVVEAA